MDGTPRLRMLASLLALTLVFGQAHATLAQPRNTWDPQRWLELIRTGDDYYNQALDVPADDEAGYRDLITQSLRAKQEALEMLRRALLLNQVENVEDLWDEANRDLFNLNENVIVLLIELEQCTAASLILEQALSDPDILPPGGPEHLEQLRPEIETCRVRLATEVPPFDRARYETLLQAADRWRGQAYAAEDDETREGNFLEASQNYGQALELLRTALLNGRLADPRGVNEAQLYSLDNHLISITLELNLCEGAERRLDQAVQDANNLPNGDPADFEARRPEIAECEARREELALAEQEVECRVDIDCDAPQVCRNYECVDPPRPQLGTSKNLRIVAYTLWGVAGATAISAIVLDVTGSSDRDEFDRLDALCPDDPGCDFGAFQDVADRLNDRKVTVGVLASASIITAVVGTILFFTSRNDEAAPPTQGSSDRAGVPRFQWSGLGGNVRIPF